MYEIRYIQEIVYREKQITALTENAELIKQTVTANKELNDDLHKKIPSLDTIINDKISKIENEYEQFSTLIKNNTKNAVTLFDLSSIESTEKIFGLRSSEESRIANQFRNYSLGIMGLIALIDILFLWKGLLSGFESLDAFSAVALSLLLLTPSIYLSKESNKHRKFEQQNLKIQQNIAAVMSVTSTMNEDDKKQIKQAITTALLENMQPSETDDSSPSIHFNVSEKLLNMIKST